MRLRSIIGTIALAAGLALSMTPSPAQEGPFKTAFDYGGVEYWYVCTDAKPNQGNDACRYNDRIVVSSEPLDLNFHR